MKIVSLTFAATLLAAPLFPAPPAVAQAPPSRNGNTWAGTHHQPTEDQVRRRERAAGVAPSQAERDAMDFTIRHLDEEILNQARG